MWYMYFSALLVGGVLGAGMICFLIAAKDAEMQRQIAMFKKLYLEIKEELRIEQGKESVEEISDALMDALKGVGVTTSETEFIDITTFEEPTGDTVLLEVSGKGEE